MAFDFRSEKHVCEIRSWCPVEKDKLPLGLKEGPLIPGKHAGPELCFGFQMRDKYIFQCVLSGCFCFLEAVLFAQLSM